MFRKVHAQGTAICLVLVQVSHSTGSRIRVRVLAETVSLGLPRILVKDEPKLGDLADFTKYLYELFFRHVERDISN